MKCEALYLSEHNYRVLHINFVNLLLLFVGGDDCILKGWDLRTDCTQPVCTSKRYGLLANKKMAMA